MGLDELHRGHIPNRAVRPLLILLSPPGRNHDLCFLLREKPVLVHALIQNAPFKHSINTKHVLDRLPWLDEVPPHPVLAGPRIQRSP